MNKNIITLDTFRKTFVPAGFIVTQGTRKKDGKSGNIGDPTGTRIHIVSKKKFVEDHMAAMLTAKTPVTKSQAEKAFNVYRREKVQEMSNQAAAALLKGQIQVEGVTANKDGELTGLKLEKRATTSKATVEKAREVAIEGAESADDLDKLIAQAQARKAALQNAPVEIEAAPANPEAAGVRQAAAA